MSGAGVELPNSKLSMFYRLSASAFDLFFLLLSTLFLMLASERRRGSWTMSY